MIKTNFRNRVASLALGAAMAISCVPAGVYADADTGSVEMTALKVNSDITYYYTDQTADTYTVNGEAVTPTEIEGTDVKYYTTDKGTTLYGSASMSYLEYWKGENIESSTKTETKGTTQDQEKRDDLGAFDAVSRATVAHGIFRHGFQFLTQLHGVSDTDKKDALMEIDPVINNGKLTGTARENGTTGSVQVPEMDDTFTVDGVQYTIGSYNVLGFQRIPVAVNSQDYAKAEILNKTDNGTTATKTFDNVTIGGKDGAGNEVTASTGGIKTLSADGTYGAASEGKSTTGFDVAVDKVTYEYNTRFGDYVDAYIYLKKADGSELSKNEFLKYAASYLTAEYEYYGDTNPDTNSNAKPIATYGTKNAADTWWSSNHGIRVDAGFNFDSLRLGGSGSDTSADGIYNKGAAESKQGYWKVIYKAAGYNDVEATVEIKEQTVTKDVNCEVSKDRKTIQVNGLDEKAKNILADSETKVVLSDDYGDVATLENNADGKYTVPDDVDLVGYYYLTISSEKYADITAEIDLNPTVSVSAYGDELTLGNLTDAYKKALGEEEAVVKIVAWEGRKQTEVATLANSADGVYDLSAVNGLTAGKEYTLSVSAKGYNEVSVDFKYTKKDATISLNKTAATIYAKKPASQYRSVALKATVEGKDNTVTWTSSNSKVATVNGNGVVTAKSAGTATITATANGVSKKCTVTVKNPTIKVKKTKVTVKKKKKVSVKATATPSAKVTYKSSKKKVATVTSKGVVKGKKKGTAKITISANGVSKTVTVKVK